MFISLSETRSYWRNINSLAATCTLRESHTCVYERAQPTPVRKSPRMKIENGFSKRNFPARKWSACTAQQSYSCWIVCWILTKIIQFAPHSQLQPYSWQSNREISRTHNSRVAWHKWEKKKSKKREFQIWNYRITYIEISIFNNVNNIIFNILF